MWWIAPAASATDVDVFELAPALVRGTGSPQGEAPTTGSPQGEASYGPAVGVVGLYTREPVVARTAQGDLPAVPSLLPWVLAAGLAGSERLRADLVLPVYARVEAPWADFDGPALGDLRLQATVALDGGEGPVHLALIPRLGLPTGSAGALVGRGWHGGLRAALGGEERAAVGWLLNAGATAAEAQTLQEGGRALGSVAEAVASAWVRLGPARLGAEADVQLALARPEGEGNDVASGHLFAQAQSREGLGLAAGAGTGLLPGVGNPQWRAFLGLSWSYTRHDADADGWSDARDACPQQPEDLDGHVDEDGCPEPDNDADFVPDLEDACPEPEDLDGFEDADGCPDPDNDKDGLLDGADRCPGLAGGSSTRGCPDSDGDLLADLDDQCPQHPGSVQRIGCPDTDGDGFVDPQDRCPQQPGPDGGCPELAVVTPEQIVIHERIEFELGSSTLLPESAPVLEAVLAILLREPSIARLEVQGHTDNAGSDEANARLSQSRAEAVARYLTERGVDAQRVVAKGYGETRPLFTNKTASGRDKNRRVQFVILERR
jgi:outer membrane protein OmpA-like peptidoglycan-associated protein